MVPLSVALIDPCVISRLRYLSTLNISDIAIFTIEHQQEVIGSLSNGDNFNDLTDP